MRVVGATFPDRAEAVRALEELREAYELAPSDASLAQYGSTGSESGDLTLLAGRFWDERLQPVRETIERYGGRIVVDIDEAATRRHVTAPAANQWSSPASRGGAAIRPGDRQQLQ